MIMQAATPALCILGSILVVNRSLTSPCAALVPHGKQDCTELWLCSRYRLKGSQALRQIALLSVQLAVLCAAIMPDSASKQDKPQRYDRLASAGNAGPPFTEC